MRAEVGTEWRKLAKKRRRETSRLLRRSSASTSLLIDVHRDLSHLLLHRSCSGSGDHGDNGCNEALQGRWRRVQERRVL